MTTTTTGTFFPHRSVRSSTKKVFSFFLLLSTLTLNACGPVSSSYLSAAKPVSTNPENPAGVQNLNLILNPGFEEGMNLWQSWANSSTTNKDQFAGALALEVGNAAGGVGQEISTKLIPDATYELSGYARITNPADYAHIAISLKNSAGVEVLNKAVQITSNQYSIYKFNFTVPAGAVTGQVGIWKNAGSSMLYVDELKLIPSAAVITPIPQPVTPLPILSPAPNPAPISSGLGYPFGSHKVPYVAGILPNNISQAEQDNFVKHLYDNWKSSLRTTCGDYMVYFNSSKATVSEGMGYGMVITAIMAGYDPQAKLYFDGLYNFAHNHPAFSQSPDLMEWMVNSDCSKGGGGGWAALDGDFDIAMGLLLADVQWGSSGAINYKAEAIKRINAIKAVGFKSGDGNYIIQGNGSRASDYMISHFKAFKKATGDVIWDKAVDRSYQLLDIMQTQFSPATGLIPDWIISPASAPRPSHGFEVDGNANEGDYFWNSCRIPWRLATDYVTSGDSRAKTVTSRMTSFFQRSSGGNPLKVYPAYKLDGTPLETSYNAQAFSSPITAGAMVDGTYQTFLNNMFAWNISNPANVYFNNELQLLPMILTTGNWWQP